MNLLEVVKRFTVQQLIDYTDGGIKQGESVMSYLQIKQDEYSGYILSCFKDSRRNNTGISVAVPCVSVFPSVPVGFMCLPRVTDPGIPCCKEKGPCLKFVGNSRLTHGVVSWSICTYYPTN